MVCLIHGNCSTSFSFTFFHGNNFLCTKFPFPKWSQVTIFLIISYEEICYYSNKRFETRLYYNSFRRCSAFDVFSAGINEKSLAVNIHGRKNSVIVILPIRKTTTHPSCTIETTSHISSSTFQSTKY